LLPFAGDQHAGEQACAESEDDPGDDAHDDSLVSVVRGTRMSWQRVLSGQGASRRQVPA
jgi:hypothetical protein